jgi:hypothetical protein
MRRAPIRLPPGLQRRLRTDPPTVDQNPRADVADRVERLDDSDQQHRAWHRQRATAILDVTNHINVEQQMQRLDNSIVILRSIESETGQTSSTRQTMLN